MKLITSSIINFYIRPFCNFVLSSSMHCRIYFHFLRCRIFFGNIGPFKNLRETRSLWMIRGTKSRGKFVGNKRTLGYLFPTFYQIDGEHDAANILLTLGERSIEGGVLIRISVFRVHDVGSLGICQNDDDNDDVRVFGHVPEYPGKIFE